MFMPMWLFQLQRSLFRQSPKSPNTAPRSLLPRRSQLWLEPLEDRLAPSAATTVNLISVNIVPDLTNQTAQATLTAQVTSSGGLPNEGVVSFTMAGVSGQGDVANGTTSVQLTVPLQKVLYGLSAALSYTDSANPANFADSNVSKDLSTSIWNGLLPASLTFDASNSEQMQFTVANQSLFGASYSSSTGLLSQIKVGGVSLKMSYIPIGNNELPIILGVPWGMIFHNSEGQFTGIADVETASDGSLEWVVYDSNHQPISTAPYGG